MATALATSGPPLKSTVARPSPLKDVSKEPSGLYRAATKSLSTKPAVRSLPSGNTVTSVSPREEEPNVLRATPPEPNVGSSRPPLDGVVRSSSTSSRGRNVAGRRVGRGRERVARATRGRSQERTRTGRSPLWSGPRYNGDDIARARRPFARAVLGPVGAMLGGWTPPADSSFIPSILVSCSDRRAHDPCPSAQAEHGDVSGHHVQVRRSNHRMRFRGESGQFPRPGERFPILGIGRHRFQQFG